MSENGPSDLAQKVKRLTGVVSKLPEKDQTFAKSLCTQFAAKGSLSDKQVFWVDKMIQAALGTAPPAETPELGSTKVLREMFATAAKIIKHPTIVIDAPGIGDIKLWVAGPMATIPGSISIASNSKHEGQAKWYGRIIGDTYHPAKSQPVTDEMIDFLRAFVRDPIEAASAYGKLSGKCCFCNSKLTDPKSTGVGYGPECAKRWNAPWGQVKHEFKAEAVS